MSLNDRETPPAGARAALGDELSGGGEPAWLYNSVSSARRAIQRRTGERLVLWVVRDGNWIKEVE